MKRPPQSFLLYVLLLVVLLAVRLHVVEGFGLGAALFQPKGLVIKSARGHIPSLLEASDFFVESFWVGKVGGGATELSDRQRRSISSSQFYEFRSRYAGIGRGQAELIICELPSENMVIGCVGVEVSSIPDGNLKSSTSVGRFPLMSNLAVGKKFRKKGIAKKLVMAVERLVRYEWGYDDCYLYVEERNLAAVRLYQKLGYKRVWVDKEATTLLPSTNGKLQNSSTKIICMRKRLNLGLLGRLLPL